MNKVMLLGRLTRDPEVRSTTTGKVVVSFTLAVNRRTKDREADFINCVAWEKTAELIKNYCQKGRQIAVVGRIQTRSWESEGKKNYITEVVVEEMHFADSRRDDNGPGTFNVDRGDSLASMIPQQSEDLSPDNGFYPADEDADDLPF